MSRPPKRRSGLVRASLGVSVFASLLAVAGQPAAQVGPPAPGRPVGQPQIGLDVAPVQITTAAGETHRFDAEIADRRATRNYGMMFREDLAADAGMLFLYEEPQRASFWMRNTLIPLDIIFIAPDGRILRIHENAQPLDETPIPSGGVVQSVLEIRGGRARELGLAVGDLVASIALSPLWRRAPLDGGATAQ